MSSTTVVNIYKELYDISIMRPGYFGNPFKIGVDGDRDEVISKYREWLRTQPSLIDLMKCELKGKRLGCCCKPKPCHGDIIVEFIEN